MAFSPGLPLGFLVGVLFGRDVSIHVWKEDLVTRSHAILCLILTFVSTLVMPPICYNPCKRLMGEACLDQRMR